MTMQDCLNQWIEKIGCSSRELARASEVSEGAVSRYRSGERVPGVRGQTVKRLAAGLSQLSGGKYDEKEILLDLTKAIRGGILLDEELFLDNLRHLVASLGISYVELARELNFDPSYISRILSGARYPAHEGRFTDQVASFVARRFEADALAPVLGVPAEGLGTQQGRQEETRAWLSASHGRHGSQQLDGFLYKMDSFDLNEYIRAIRFDELKVPTAPFQLPTSRTVTGLHDMMEVELDFLKAAVLSRSMEDVILYSDMPMDEMAKDRDFAKKWMFGMAMLLKKGLRLRMIHDVNRPFSEMMLGLESYLPMYMTGQISPYYLRHSQTDVFLHFLKVSGTVALAGEAIAGYHAEGRYILTKRPEDLRYYKARANALLSRAMPLMQIYRSEDKDAFREKMTEIMEGRENVRVITGALPIFALPRETLEGILARHGTSPEIRRTVLNFAEESRAFWKGWLVHGRMELEIPSVPRESYGENPVHLSLYPLFLEDDFTLNEEEYRLHVDALEAFSAECPNLTLRENEDPPFRNIEILIVDDSFVLVSKAKAPAIHFLIHHPRMVEAFRHFVVPIKE